MWWRLLHGDTQPRRIRYIRKVNNRVCMESLCGRPAGLCRQNPARSTHLVETDATTAKRRERWWAAWDVLVSAAGPAALQR
jgi:hypothetical protein